MRRAQSSVAKRDAHPFGLVEVVARLLHRLDHPARNLGAAHVRHACDLAKVADGHDARQHRLGDAQRCQLVDHQRVVIDVEEELGDGEVGGLQLVGQVLAVGGAIG